MGLTEYLLYSFRVGNLKERDAKRVIKLKLRNMGWERYEAYIISCLGYHQQCKMTSDNNSKIRYNIGFQLN